MRIFRELWRGKDIYRILMNDECRQYRLDGFTVDVGSGKQLASYHRFFENKQTRIECLDLALGNIDLETDRLPYSDDSVDTILIMNVLEHIYNYDHLIAELKRVLKPGGQIIGAVPFLVAYHPDPHDYWRYTKETLANIFGRYGFISIHIAPFGFGPTTAAFSQIEGVLPRLLKILFLPLVWLADECIIRLRPTLGKEKFSLGLFFRICKQ